MDRRTQKTQKAIREAFISLLSEKSVNEITVTEISKAADLGRGTFYLHYKDVFDLYEHIEDEIYSEIELILDRSCTGNDPESLLNLIRAVIEYLTNNRDTFLLLIGQENCSRSMQKLKNLLYKKIIWECPNQNSLDNNNVVRMFAISGVIGILEEWLFNRMELSHKQLAESLYMILRRFENDIGQRNDNSG
jgi:AcrR family transcriptional regulator